MTGFIRKLVNHNGRMFGFITGDNGMDYFFLPGMVQKTVEYGFKDMKVSQRVEFLPISGMGPGQWRAIEIRRIG